ncbi:MAG: hypothetical protein AB7I42_25815 [Bradyrhizobium sp.]|uniref:hypothetical protein n=1 Tax=Bradyrhizobium sp. TaxID=376 RepID=UPI003D114F28
MGRSRSREWSEEDIATMRRLYEKTSISDLEKILARPRVSIYSKANHLKLAKGGGMGRKPTKLSEEIPPEERGSRLPWKEREHRLKLVDRALARMMKREGVCLTTEQ